MSSRLKRESRRLVWLVLNLVILICAQGMIAIAASERPAEGAQVFRDCPDCPEMVPIPIGSYVMGLSDAEASKELKSVPFLQGGWMARMKIKQEVPQHSVTLSHQIAMSEYPITRGEFAVFVRDTHRAMDQPCTVHAHNRSFDSAAATWESPGFAQSDRDPVVCVNWEDAKAYAAWLNMKVKTSGSPNMAGDYRLPSEAEWEYAARAGSHTTYWWGDEIGTNTAACNECVGGWHGQTSPVGMFPSNPFGISGVAGNVFQWTEDCWNENYNGAPGDGSAWITGDCGRRVARGGGWLTDPWALGTASRTSFPWDKRSNVTGFRLVRLSG